MRQYPWLTTLYQVMVSNICYFHPDPWGFMIQFDLRIFFRCEVQPPTRYMFLQRFQDSTVASDANVAFWVRHTKATVKTFSPLQLARTIHGFGIAGVEDPALYRQLCNDTWLIEMCNDCLAALIDWDDYCIEKLFWLWLVEEAAVCTWCRSRSWESYWPIS